MDVEDPDTIQSKIEECLISDTGAYEEEKAIIPLVETKRHNLDKLKYINIKRK